ncbi:MAG: HNH endonuclease [Mycobacteriales bacterium]
MHSLAMKVASDWHLEWSQHGEDLVQTGWVAAMRANELFTPGKYKFMTYAWWSINGRMRDSAAAIVGKFELTDIDLMVDELPVDGNSDHDLFLRELLDSPDGLELIAEELSTPDRPLRDESKRGAAIRREQRQKLKQRYEEQIFNNTTVVPPPTSRDPSISTYGSRAARTRVQLLERDGNNCSLCGEVMSEDDRTIDHIRPKSKGGSGQLSNLQLAHARCNEAKGDAFEDEAA